MTEQPHGGPSDDGRAGENPAGEDPGGGTGRSGPFPGRDHGTIGEEATKLAEAVQEWLGEWRGGGLGTGGLGAAQDVWAAATTASHDGAECRMCPICTGLRVLRGTRPEVFEHLSDAAASLAAALRELAGDPGGRGPGRPPGVERIDLG